MYVGNNGSIYAETAHPAYRFIVNFLVSCCEPVSRTHRMVHYRIDAASLSAASAEGTYTPEMIRHVLRYFGLDEHRELAIDLSRYAELEAWAGSTQADLDPGSLCQWPLSFTPRQEQLDKTDAVPTTQTVTPTPAHHVVAPSSDVESVPTKETMSAPAGRRVLRLGAARQSANSNSNSSNSYSSRESDHTRAREPHSADNSSLPLSVSTKESPVVGSALPLVHLAVIKPAALCTALPDPVEAMLREEEESSRMCIVLQPRLRRFDHAGTAATKPSARDGEDELFYFLLSRDRAKLESVLDCVREFVQPVPLHGAMRWILSDVDREAVTTTGSGASSSSSRAAGGEAAAAVNGGRHRPDVLRRLFDPQSAAAQLFWRHESTSCHVLPGELRRHSSGVTDKAAPTTPSPSLPSRVVYKSQLRHGTLRHVKERLFRVHGIRADCFYDYAQDEQQASCATHNDAAAVNSPSSSCELRVTNLTLARHTRLRHYQIASLERFRHGGRAHSGVVVLPCGAGKTLMGIAAAAALQRTTVVMCINNMSVFQWRREFLRWTNLTRAEVTVCTAKQKEMPGKVFITTYSMVIASRSSSSNHHDGNGGNVMGASAKESEAVLQSLTRQTWGLLLLDEVHAALAHHFQDVLNVIRHKCVLGLSATLLREDDKIGDLRHLVGPKLYEANWLELTAQGYLAAVACAEVQCAMPPAFQRAYLCRMRAAATHTHLSRPALTDAPARSRRGGTFDAVTHTLASCNPYKLWCTQALLEFHRHRSPPDKVILFCDYLADVRFYAHHLNLPFMDQRTSEAERAHLLQYFQHSSTVNAIILTRVGDVALDLPCASVIIQISGLGASRRQEAQRLGRILRPKPPSLDNTCSYFYTLVSRDTHEMRTSYERQSWLRDQGFGYRVLDGESVLRSFLHPAATSATRTLCCVGPPRWWFQVHPPPSFSSASRAASSRSRLLRAVRPRDDANDFAGEVVCYDGAYWMSFSAEASASIQHSFVRAKESCVLRASVLGARAMWDVREYETVEPDAHAAVLRRIGEQESWTVRFSSGDAPNTFGTVTMGEADVNDGDGVQENEGEEEGLIQRARVRRIRCGPLNTHMAQSGDKDGVDMSTGSGGGGDKACGTSASCAKDGLSLCTDRCIQYALSMLHADVREDGEGRADAAGRTRYASEAMSSSSDVEGADDEDDDDEMGGSGQFAVVTFGVACLLVAFVCKNSAGVTCVYASHYTCDDRQV